MEEFDESEYGRVEYILDHKWKDDKKLVFLVKWVAEDLRTWEPLTILVSEEHSKRELLRYSAECGDDDVQNVIRRAV